MMADSLNTGELRRLVEVFDRRYDKSILYCPLLSAAIAGRNNLAMKLIMQTALSEKVRPRTIDEIILQSHLFLGFPAMIEASRMFAAVRQPRYRKYRLPGPYNAGICREWNRQGKAKIKRIYGSTFERLIPYINSFSPQILTWMINDGYGRVLSRPGASFKLRELSVVAILTVTSYKNQLRAHVRGCVNFGVPRALIEKTIVNCRYFCSAAKIKAALKILERTYST